MRTLPPSLPPFSRSYWVSPGHLLGGFFPGDRDPAVARHKLDALLDCGVTHIINLMQPLERDHAGRIFDPYLDIFRHAAAQRGLETCCLQRGIRDLSVPSIPDMKGTLDDIDAAIAAGGCVYVHCWGGRGLTGTVLGCWLARHGERNPLAALSLLTSNARKHFPRVPEMPQQQAFVRLWSIGQ